MSEIRFIESSATLEIPVYSLEEGFCYASKNNIERVRIRAFKRLSDKHDISFDFLDEGSEVSAITFADDVKVGKFDGEGLYRLKRLREITYFDKKVRLDFSRLPKLEALNATYNSSFDKLSSLGQLKKLLVISVATADCSFLAGLDDLVELRMSGGSALSMKGVEKLRSLVGVRLDYMPKLEDASSLAEIKGLTELYVERCKKLSDFSFISGSKSLKKLFASDIDSLRFVPTCPSLQDLSFWHLADGDMTPLLESSSLERVHFTPEKKHYSHTLKEVLNLMGLS